MVRFQVYFEGRTKRIGWQDREGEAEKERAQGRHEGILPEHLPEWNLSRTEVEKTGQRQIPNMVLTAVCALAGSVPFSLPHSPFIH